MSIGKNRLRPLRQRNRKMRPSERLRIQTNGGSRYGNDWDAMRQAVKQRDNYTCCQCGAKGSDGARLTVDHRVPVAQGGATTMGNLWTLCLDCHIDKPGKVNRRGARMLKGLKR